MLNFEMFKKELFNYKNNTENILFGDSYFELLNYEETSGIIFDEVFDNTCNLGVGGSTISDLLAYSKFLRKDLNVKNVVLNIGINDINGEEYYSIDDIKNNLDKLIDTLNKLYPNSKTHIFTILHTPFCKKNILLEKNFNNYILNSKYNTIDINELFLNKEDYMESDLLHLNKLGYSIFINKLKDIL